MYQSSNGSGKKASNTFWTKLFSGSCSVSPVTVLQYIGAKVPGQDSAPASLTKQDRTIICLSPVPLMDFSLRRTFSSRHEVKSFKTACFSTRTTYGTKCRHRYHPAKPGNTFEFFQTLSESEP